MITVKTVGLSYTWVSMLAEIGGYVGLLLGASVLDLAGIVEKGVSAMVVDTSTK